jgi:hypothetical protein
VSSFAVQSSKALEKYNRKGNGTPCVQAFLNAESLNYGTFLSKKSKGILTVSKDNLSKVYFNVTLKSNIGKKDEPPIYLRFIKQKSLDINELLEYAEDGDEIYIEEFVSSQWICSNFYSCFAMISEHRNSSTTSISASTCIAAWNYWLFRKFYCGFYFYCNLISRN